MFDREQVLEDLTLEKKEAMPKNTARNQKYAIANFENFTLEKYGETSKSICKKLSKEKNIKVPCGVIQSWVTWSLKQNHLPATIRTRFWFIKDYFYDHGIELTNLQIKKNIKLPKIQKDELYAPA